MARSTPILPGAASGRSANVAAPTIRFLTADECHRLVAVCESDFANIVAGALATGCRYGELTRLRAADFNPHAGTIAVQISKSGKPRHVALSRDGVALFAKLTRGLDAGELIFTRINGEPWAEGLQKRRIRVASHIAGISPPARFHLLRHSYASALAMSGVPIPVIAAQLGHANTVMTEKHYAHLSKSYVAETVRAKLPNLFGK